MGNTKGYRNHPQLTRFKNTNNPLDSINRYLAEVYEESQRRGYNFNKDKIDYNYSVSEIPVTKGQIEYEKNHLLKKLEIRDIEKFYILLKETKIEIHPLFRILEGDVEEWEKIS